MAILIALTRIAPHPMGHRRRDTQGVDKQAPRAEKSVSSEKFTSKRRKVEDLPVGDIKQGPYHLNKTLCNLLNLKQYNENDLLMIWEYANGKPRTEPLCTRTTPDMHDMWVL